MDSHAHIDIEAARLLNEQLRRVDQRVIGAIECLCTARLGDRWRDDQFDRFVGQFHQTRLKLEEFCSYARVLATQIDQDIANAESIRKLG